MPSLRQVARRWILAGWVASLVWVAPVSAAEIRVITSGAFTEAYKQLVPLYEAATGDKVISAFGASIGNAPDSIPSRLARGEAFDLVILSEGGWLRWRSPARWCLVRAWIWHDPKLARQFAREPPSPTSARWQRSSRPF